MMNMRCAIVAALNSACVAVDSVAYRPAVVWLTQPLPRWWACGLAKLSMRLDDRWGTQFWTGEDAPATPEGVCAACRRRAAWLLLGGDPEAEMDESGANSAEAPAGDFLAW